MGVMLWKIQSLCNFWNWILIHIEKNKWDTIQKLQPLGRKDGLQVRKDNFLPSRTGRIFPSRTIPNKWAILFSKRYEQWVSLASIHFEKYYFISNLVDAAAILTHLLLAWPLKMKTLVSILLGVKLRFHSSASCSSACITYTEPGHSTTPQHHGFAAWTPKDYDMERLQLSYVLFCLSI